MDLFEYQAKELFAEYGVPVPKDKVANTAEEAREITTAFAADGIPQVVVKAQVKTGGRGKAGGVKLADSPADAFEKAQRIIGMDIKGHTVHRVLIAEATDITSEYYLSFLLDRANRTFLSICSVDGGMEIEELAHTNPDAIARIPVSPLTGVDHDKALEIVRAGRIPAEAEEGAALVAERLWAMFTDEDATLAEVNPLVLTPDGKVLALDGKVTLDDNAAFRQPDQAKFADICRRPTRSRSGPRRSTSTTSSSTARSASSATARAWSCPPSTWSPTRARRSAGSRRPTSSTSAAAPRPR